MKKMFAVLSVVVMFVATAGLVTAAANIGVNFRHNGNTPMGTDAYDGVSDWTDVDTANGGPIAIDGGGGATVTWSANNTWWWPSSTTAVTPEERLYHGYLDDLGAGCTVTLTGLTNWLVSEGLDGYIVRVYARTDNPDQFSDVEIYSGGSVVDTIVYPVAGPGLGDGAQAVADSVTLTADTITIDPTPHVSGERGTIAGVQIIGVDLVLAHSPDPNGLVDLASGDVPDPLTWLSPDNPDEPNILDVTAYDVYFYGVPTGDVDGDDPNFTGITPLAGTVNNPTGGSVARPAMNDDYTYFWRVDSTVVWDSNELLTPGTYTEVTGGYEQVLVGAFWSFTTLPTYFAPEIAMDSVITAIDLLPASLSATITGNSEPLNAPVLTLLTDDIDFPTGAVTTFTPDVSDYTNPTATLTTDTAGTYKVKLEVNDGTTFLEKVVEVVVYADTCEAKKNAPSGWTQNPYDFDGNCVVDLLDFAEVAAVWLDDTGMDVQETYSASVAYIPVTASSIIFEAETYITASEGVGIEDPNPAGTVNCVFIYPGAWME